MDLETLFEKNRLFFIFLVLGILLVGLGILGFKIFNFTASGPKVEILGSEDALLRPADSADFGGQGSEGGVLMITVEASGEVLKPGVYELEIGSRINDLLTMAGGIGADADREWVSKNINLAAKLTDGAKIYIPKNNEVGSKKLEAGNEVGSGILEKININTASESELDTLVGVGPVTAKKIIDGRPYQTIEELLSKKAVNKSVWEKIKDEISVY